MRDIAKNKMSINFDGYKELKTKLDSIGGESTKRAVEGALKASQQLIARQANEAMLSHERTGTTRKSIVKDGNVEWEGDTASINIGFDLKNGGLPSVFLMYGTKLHGQPHIKPDRELYNAVYGAKTKKEIKKIQEEVFNKVIGRLSK